jgi:hypothetical protein
MANSEQWVKVRDRIGLLEPVVAREVLQRLTWLMSSPERMTQAIDDVEETRERFPDDYEDE